MIRDYIKIKNNSLRILFPKHLTREIFENILLQGYGKTTSHNNFTSITFSLQALEWIDIFELSLLSLWINKIISKNKKVFFSYPLKESTFGFLLSIKFIHFTEKLSSNSQYKIGEIGQEDSGAIFYPLTFLNINGFNTLIEDLNYKNRLKQVFKEIADIDLIKSGYLRDIILGELGENMFIHGDGKNASIIATSYKQIEPSQVQNRIELASFFEKNFFKILGPNSYIQIVVSDNGKGIYKKLINTYKNDVGYAKHKEKPSHGDLIEYAFLPLTSSRDISERLNFIEKALDEDIKNNPPVTGLNKLKLIVRKFRGLILVRSGKGIVCYDYLTNGELVFPLTNDKNKKFKNIASFDGVQYKILIPLKKPDSTLPIQTKFHFQETKRKSSYEYRRLDDYFSSECKYKMETAKNQYLRFEQDIENFHIINSEKNVILILDLCEAKVVNQKLLHLVILKLSQSQTNTQINSFINLPSEFIELINYKFDSSKPLVGFDNNFSRIILGVNDEERSIFNRIISQTKIEKREIDAFVNKFPFLFDLSTLSFIHNRETILSQSNINIRNRIKEIIINPSNDIFHKEAKVLIPTNLYCEGYFEIGTLFKNISHRYYVNQWLKIGFHILKPNVVISLSEHCGAIISELQLDYNREIDSITLETPIKESVLIRLRSNIDKSSRILIFTDVISTSKTVLKLLNTLSSYNIINVVTIVNATKYNNYKIFDLNIPISQIVHHPIEYFDILPDNWLYSEIFLTDPKTNFLVHQDDLKAEGSLLKKYAISTDKINGYEVLRNKFLEDIILPFNLSEEGHFVTNKKHFSYLFNIAELVNKFEHLIVDSIISHYYTEIQRRTKNKELNNNYILHFSYNPGVINLCNSLTKRLKKSEVIAIDFSKNINPITKDINNEKVIIIDDAFITGESVINLIDYCELRGVKTIFVYILIKRGTSLSARKLENIKKYGHSLVSVRYLFDVEVPNFNVNDCPICKEKKALQNLETFIDDEHTEFWNYISYSHVKKNERIVTGDFKFVSISQSKNNIILRWKIETSKHELVSQKELIRYLINFQENIDLLSILFQIYSYEKENLLNPDSYTSHIFYTELKNKLLETGTKILRDNEELEIQFQYSIIDVIFWLDIETINEIFLSFVKIAFKDKRRLFNLIFIIFKNKERCTVSLNKYSSIIKSQVDLGVSFDENTMKTIDTFTEIIDRQFSDYMRYADQTRTAIRVLFFESYHEFPRLYKALQDKLNKSPKDIDEVLNLWNSLKDIINKSINNLKLLQKTGISRDRVYILDNRISEIQDFVSKSEILLKSFENPVENSIYHGMSDSIIGENGIKSILASLRLDLKKIIDYLTEKYKKDFIEKNISFYYTKPDYPCLIFGESSQIISSIDNLFENICSHSDCSKFVLNMTKSDDEQYINIEFFDNGIGGKIDKGVGLKTVMENIKKYLGEFSISTDCKNEGFNTSTKIQLINLSNFNLI